MKKALYFLSLGLLLATTTQAQDKPVSVYITQFNVTPADLESGLKDSDATFRFDAKIKTIIAQDTSVQLAAFDPEAPVSEKWVILAKDGEAPTKKEFKTFYKYHNTKKDGVNAKVLADSWAIESEDENSLVVSFQYETSSLPKKYHFLEDTKGLAYINKSANRLTHVIFKNDTPLQVKQYKTNSYELYVKYYYDTQDKVYLIEWEDLTMETSNGKIKELSEFNDYRKEK
ncbi:hypothetical protein N7E81_17540 [Reichenbachiella carrageenanivorans]|uniref:Intein N-terminal splicing region n=1 Tax=Reichenbachiella carrageenanivorans TaxID=2979869 RepID=A0ABY6D0D2_9BACT|nr:hypothetical protein [Reichenbachiella carrageenanivorans]UXX79159.1 hypothetical protein N7E81_17540 [Reichenbachiella carrageenanivorans]